MPHGPPPSIPLGPRIIAAAIHQKKENRLHHRRLAHAHIRMPPAKTRRPFVLAGWKHRVPRAVEPVRALGDIHCRLDEPLLVRALAPGGGWHRRVTTLPLTEHLREWNWKHRTFKT